MITVHMAGLIYFHACSLEETLALAPDGRRPEAQLPAHQTSLWVEENQLESDDWWQDYKFNRPVTIVNDDGNEVTVNVIELRIPEPAEITFPDGGDGRVQVVNLDQGLAKLKDSDPDFEPDLNSPNAIARVPIRGGKLEAFSFLGESVVQWRIEKYSGPITVRARVRDDRRSVTLKQSSGPFGTEIVLANTPDLIADGHDHAGGAHGGASAPSHFKLYEKLNRNRSGVPLTFRRNPGMEAVSVLQFDHSFLKFLTTRPQFPPPECTPTCC